ncbi:DUF5719 family protein [Pseudolysinimonas sp.]|uniref:DUF5719 family protein n=1 Tax=Pseudolysinimonas sp. TaxID=2680009 RepID=UPI003F81E9A3
MSDTPDERRPEEPSTEPPGTAAPEPIASGPVAPGPVAPESAGSAAAASDIEARARDAERAAPADRAGRGRRAAVIGVRVVSGAIGVAIAVAVVAAVGLIPLRSVAAGAPQATITPEPATQLRVCPGALLRLSDTGTQAAGTPSGIGAPQRRDAATGGTISVDVLARGDAGTGGSSSAPTALRIPGGTGLLAGAQSQTARSDDVAGFAASDCAEPSSSAWLVGGSTATGRTTLLTLANPTQVDATVALDIYGEKGPVSAPGLAGIAVAAGSQRVLSLAGFAPDLASPVVHVTARGGRIVAALQQTTVRGLDPGGVDLVGPTADPATSQQIPGVRVLGAAAIAGSIALADWTDAVPSIRVANPGAESAKVHVSIVPETAGATGASFDVVVPAGTTNETGLDAGIDTDSGQLAIPDGEYTVSVDSDHPVVAAVRISTAVANGSGTPQSDFAWDVAASALQGPTLITVAPGPDPRIALLSRGAAGTVVLKGVDGAADVTVAVPAGGQASASVVAGASYRLQGADGMSASIGYAGPAEISGYAVTSPRPVSGPIVVHP